MNTKPIRFLFAVLTLAGLTACSALKATDNRYQNYKETKPLVLKGDYQKSAKPLYKIPDYKPTKPATAGVSIMPPGSHIAQYKLKKDKTSH